MSPIFQNSYLQKCSFLLVPYGTIRRKWVKLSELVMNSSFEERLKRLKRFPEPHDFDEKILFEERYRKFSAFAT